MKCGASDGTSFGSLGFFDIFKTQQAVMKLLSFLAEKRGFWATAC